MTGWIELKEAFWAVVEGEPDERARRLAALAAIDAALPGRLEALLAADERGGSLDDILACEPVHASPDRIGGYEVIGVLGAGGMGDVYRAHDARLHRDVAIKVLPPALTRNSERLARFEREAQVLASLNHRHIAQVYGLDESGSAPALVMELVEGPTLTQVIAGQGNHPLNVARALTIASQIADGLDAAHEKGIIHRDLKPGNVALTTDGDVKILDFGVAKTSEADAANRSAGPAATEAGVILGTPAYMSPEQARGLPVDKRTDIWAFGCLLYELLTRRQTFAGATASDTIAAVLEHEPDLTALPAETPQAVRSLLRHCLEKDPKRRLRDIADARMAIADALDRPVDEGVAQRAEGDGSRQARWPLTASLLGLLTGVVGASGAFGLLRVTGQSPSEDPPQRTIASIPLPRGMQLAGSDLKGQGSETRFAVSPDGRKIVVVADDDLRHRRLWIRDLGSAAFQPLPDSDGASSPFWSPDSQSIAFLADGKLKNIQLAGGTTTTVQGTGFHAGTWSRENLILFAPAASSPLFTVSAFGGTASPATALDRAGGEIQHGDPVFLPDGRNFLYVSMGTPSGALDLRGVYLASLDSRAPRKLLIPAATQPRYANGYVFFVERGTLMAQPFDVETMALSGAPRSIVEDVTISTVGATGSTAAYSVSDRVLAYQAAVRTESRLIWFDRTGQQLTTLTKPGDYGDVALSPDGTRLAVSVRDPTRFTRDLWLYGVDDGQGQRFTFDPGDEFAPVWSPDGKRMLFSTMVKGLVHLRAKDVHGAGDGAVVEADDQKLGRFAADWSRDGRFMMYIAGGRAIARSDLWIAPAANPRKAVSLLDSTFVETQARFSPDGRWFVYASNETGQLEVSVDRFPERGARQLVSRNGGEWPRWSRDGSEVFYLAPDNRLMVAAVHAAGDKLNIGAPRALFAVHPRPPVRLDAYPYEVSLDGRRFVVNTLVEDPASTITLVLNWAAALMSR
jgi:Tol biopolymer transport system component